jgi:hypothetical protein
LRRNFSGNNSVDFKMEILVLPVFCSYITIGIVKTFFNTISIDISFQTPVIFIIFLQMINQSISLFMFLLHLKDKNKENLQLASPQWIIMPWIAVNINNSNLCRLFSTLLDIYCICHFRFIFVHLSVSGNRTKHPYTQTLPFYWEWFFR